MACGGVLLARDGAVHLSTLSRRSGSYDLPTVIRTLLIDGFHLDAVRRSPGHVVLNVHRYDRFGVSIAYSIVLFEEAANSTALAGFSKAAEYDRCHPLVVAPAAPEGVHAISLERFLSLLGGAVDEAIVRRSDIAGVLNTLGRHTLPEGMAGDPEDRLEEAVAAALQFLIGDRAHRWGIDRRFEALPDGVVPAAFVLLYDAKSYSAAYGVDADDVRRFADYVNEFNRRYGSILGSVFAFIVVTGEFAHGDDQHARRSAELYAECRTTLCHITARALGEMVALLRGRASLRSTLDWKPLLARHSVSLADVEAEVARLERDGLIKKD